MQASIVIRTYNEVRYLPQLMRAIKAQQGIGHEVILVDSGSTDGTLEVAKANDARVEFISREEFSFGRSLNRGCDSAHGDVLVFISGHCVPMHERWLANLCAPILDGRVAYAYGKQRGGEGTKYSEDQLFRKYFPDIDKVPQEGFFVNNANAALSRDVWKSHRFDEDVTGLEDMELAKRLLAAGHRTGYVADAPVHHYHHETWRKVLWRYEREALALRRIMPEVQVTGLDAARYFASGVFLDVGTAVQDGRFLKEAGDIVRFRAMQYLGAYRGNHKHRQLSKKQKEHYFYPR